MTYANIPQELKDLKQWGLFKLVFIAERNKNTKIPYSAINGQKAKSNDTSTWTTFKEAELALRNNANDFDGLAFFFNGNYVGIDIDNVGDDIERYYTGDTDNIVSEFINATRSYTEVSQSGTGIHIIVKGKIPGSRRRNKNVEMYDNGRFFALTGKDITDVDVLPEANLQVLYDKYLKSSKVVPINHSQPTINNLSEYDIIKKALDSSSGDKFKALMYGDWSEFYTSQSEADMAFANMLAFWTGRDFAKMDTIFRQSALFREKYDEGRGKTTYGIGLLNKAINETNDIYKESSRRKVNNYKLNFLKDTKKEYPRRGQDDTGAADRIIDRYGNFIRYSYVHKLWYIYNGTYWEEDQSGQIYSYIDMVSDVIKEEPIFIPDGADEKEEEAIKKAHFKFIKHMRSNAAKQAVLKELQHRVPVVPDEFDEDQTLLNTNNGYIDLSSGELFDSDYKKMFSKKTNVEYSDTASCDEWIQFLETTFNHDKEMIDYIQTIVGYSATGSTKEQIMFVLYGNGRNGKSVFLETISNVLGSYAKSMQAKTIMVQNQSSGANSDIARLDGARLVTSSEPNEGVRLDEGLVKQITGGDKVVARQLYGKEFEFEPEFKLWLATNHKPLIRGTDDGIWRRIRLIPFTNQVPESQIDKDLKYKLSREHLGILNWIVEGALKWQKNGLKTPKQVLDASKEYRKEMDVIDMFISDSCEVGEGYEIKSSQLYSSYKEWAVENNEYTMSSTKFGREMSKKYEKKRTMNSMVYVGLKPKYDERLNFLKIGG